MVGRATRLSRFYLGHRREYLASIRFGWATTTYDSDGEPTSEPVEVELDEAAVESSLDSLRGVISQVPPAVSAKKVDGVRAYKLARNRESVELEAVKVEIDELELLEVRGSCAKVRCLCSAGTYIRSLAHDLGQSLRCGAHVAQLRRTRVAEFGIEQARPLAALEALHAEGRLGEVLIPPASLVPELPVQRVDALEAARIRHGQAFLINPFHGCSDAPLVKAVGPDGRLLCVGKAIGPRRFHPFLVF